MITFTEELLVYSLSKETVSGIMKLYVKDYIYIYIFFSAYFSKMTDKIIVLIYFYFPFHVCKRDGANKDWSYLVIVQNIDIITYVLSTFNGHY